MRVLYKTNIFIIIFLISLNINGQTSKIDSLKNLLQLHEKEDTSKINLLIETGREFLKVDLDKSLKYFENANKLADKLKFESGKAHSIRRLGSYYLKKNEYPKSLRYYTEALTAFKITGNIKEQSSCLKFIGVIYYYQGNYPVAMEYYHKAIEQFRKINNKKGIADLYMNIGVIFYSQKDSKNAIKNYQEALKIYKEIKDYIGLLNVYNNIGVLYHQEENLTKATEFYLKGIELSAKTNKFQGLGNLYNNIGSIYILQGNYKKAYTFIQKSLKISIKDFDKSLEIKSYIELASLYFYQNRYEDACKMSKKAYKKAKEAGEPYLVQRSSKILSDSYKSLNLYEEAYKYYVINKTMSDSLFNEENIREITSLELQYKYEKEEATQKQKFISLEEETKLQKNVRNSLILGITLMLMLILVILRSFFNKRKANHILEDKNNKIAISNKKLFLQKEEIQNQAEKLKTANAKLLELNKFKDDLTGMIVHDFKNPLNSIISLSENKTVKQSGMSILNMVMNILDISKYEESKMILKKNDLYLLKLSKGAIGEISVLAEQKSILIINKITNKTIVKVDKDIIERVFINILTNAIKFTPNNGRIFISIKENNSNNLSDFINVQINNNGPIIPKEKMDIIFKKFGQVSAKKSGTVHSTGLGLAFCKMAIEAQNGEIGVISKTKEGTTFWFTLTKGNKHKKIKETDTIIPKKTILDFSESDKIILKPYISKLEKLMVYEISEINEIINSINFANNKAFSYWKNEIEKVVFAMNEEKYIELLKIN